MKEKTVKTIIDILDKELSKMSDEQFCDLEYQFSTLKNIASQFEEENVVCYTNLYYINGYAIEGICLLTDGGYGGIVYHTPQQEKSQTINPPVLQVIYPNEWDEWMKTYGSLFAPKFPPFIEEN